MRKYYWAGFLILLMIIFYTVQVYAQNPLFWGADPSGIVAHDGRVFIFPTNDKKDWNDQKEWHCWSSKDLVQWTDHGVIFNTEKSGWGIDNAWAPDITYKDGIYYFYYYFQNGDKPGGIGVATSTKPEGPYTEVHGRMLLEGHDPAIFLDDDQRAFLYVQTRGYELNDDLVSLKDTLPLELSLDYKPEVFEAAYMFKRQEVYYFSIARDWNNLIYYTGDSPTGPFTFRGEIMDAYGGNNHHSIIPYRNRWIIFYHEWAKDESEVSNRRIRAEWLRFSEDGSIIPVVPTAEGISKQ